MPHDSSDRRTRRTRHALNNALVELIREKGYDAVTIQDIADRADVGRTTFYLHYKNKDELLFDHYGHLIQQFNVGILSRDELLGDVPQPEMVAYLELLAHSRAMYHTIRAAKNSAVLMRGMSDRIESNLQRSLTAIFPDAEPLTALTAYIAGAQIAYINWWMTNRTPYDASQIATMLHRMQRAAIRDAYDCA